MERGAAAWALLERVRRSAPLVHCITNLVSMDLVANALLAAGPPPPWSTPSARSPSSPPAPPPSSSTSFRMDACLGLLALRPTVVRGNPSEIIALASASRIRDAKGVDSSHESIDAVEAAKSLALSSGAVVAVSGAIDFITDGQNVIGAHNGVPMMQKITATGCAVTALIAAFVAVDPTNTLEATACALSIFGLAGELGMEMAKGPASLRMHLIDSLYGLDEKTVASRVKILQHS
uniref:hydroxyethylthiazole kinase n=1 Tax=Ananas comosus var. bracteatus TaxID=296719 RepID=A0A6V7QD26_ANACO|nr:unnamed protein product [Ananas comosus var. bracteatus]